jgi:hypothetical protein
MDKRTRANGNGERLDILEKCKRRLACIIKISSEGIKNACSTVKLEFSTLLARVIVNIDRILIFKMPVPIFQCYAICNKKTSFTAQKLKNLTRSVD